MWPFPTQSEQPKLSTMPTPEMVAEANRNPNGWIYQIEGGFGQNDAVSPDSIVGAFKVDENGHLTGQTMGYLRLMRRNEMLYTVSEQTALLSLLTNYPGVSAAKIDGVHPKGGYRLNCAITKEAFDSVIAELAANDWISAI
jgi:hypothetical protein